MKKLLAKILLVSMMGGMALALGSCGEDKPEDDMDASEIPDITEQLGLEESDTDYTNDGTLELEGVVADVPADWVGEKPTNTMRVAQYKVPGDSEVRTYVYKFPKGAGGPMGNMEDADANIARWKGEFIEAMNIETKTFENGATAFAADGTFKEKKNMADTEFTEMPDYMTVAALIPTETAVFTFKMNGPKKEVQAQKDAFMSMVESIRKSDS